MDSLPATVFCSEIALNGFLIFSEQNNKARSQLIQAFCLGEIAWTKFPLISTWLPRYQYISNLGLLPEFQNYRFNCPLQNSTWIFSNNSNSSVETKIPGKPNFLPLFSILVPGHPWKTPSRLLYLTLFFYPLYPMSTEYNLL